MLIDINPVALDFGFIKIHWYGLMYLIGFILAYWFGINRAKTIPNWNQQQVSDLIFYGALGVVIGGRVGYMLFYDFASIINDPTKAFRIWQGGMSFHGGALGVLIAGLFFTKKYSKTYLDVIDFVVPMVPLGLATGRFGNFINGELWGKPTDSFIGMKFITDPERLSRHPSMLYEMFLEGFVLFIILWLFSKKARPAGVITGLACLLYGTFRFMVEFVREPDRHIGYLAWDWLTMGQVLSIPLIIIGSGLMLWGYKKQ